MKVLVIGKGAREHALCWRLQFEPIVWGLFCAPGNRESISSPKPVNIATSDFPALISVRKGKTKSI